jgi:D-alanyl-D-alanine carboxypeptidase
VFGLRRFRGARTLGHVVRIGVTAAVLASAPATALANSKYAGIVVDAKTGKTLYASSADAYRYPASLTKIMTLYVVFEELEAGRLSLDSRLKVSKYASGRPPSKLALKPGTTIKVKDAILALVTKSANDVATVIAENIEGSETKFAQRMTRTARQIGMKKTTFRNPHGLPNSKQRTTARDMALLGRAVQERFPRYYGYFKTRSYKYKGRRYGNHNKLLGRVKGVDGIKTGYIRASGFNLVTSVKRDGRHIVAVVMGGRTGKSRNAQMVKLINRYLHKASKGRKTAPALVSRGAAPKFVAAKLRNVPAPARKPDASAPIVVAKAGPIDAKAPKAKTSEAKKPMVLALAAPPAKATSNMPVLTGSIPIPPTQVKQRMANAFDAPGLPPVPQAMPERAGDTTVTVATSDTQVQEPGWQIQIAAAETEGDAIRMLKKASAAGGSKLRKRVPYTEPVESNGKTLYRARFVGFETKTAALRACKSLKRAKFACYAIYQ